MRPLYHPRIANHENIQHGVELERDQDPAIAPFAYRFAEAQIEQKSIEDHVILHMPGGKLATGSGIKTWMSDGLGRGRPAIKPMIASRPAITPVPAKMKMAAKNQRNGDPPLYQIKSPISESTKNAESMARTELI